MSRASMRDEPAHGRCFYDHETVFSNYSAHREWGLNPNVVMEEPALLSALGDMTGARVLDLGRGDAALGRTLLEAGCRSYHGIDASERMIERATETLKWTSGTVSLGTIEAFAAPPDSFDVVVSRVVLHYVEAIAPVLRACHTCLSAGGRFIFSVVHPMVTSHDARTAGEKRTNWIVDEYFVRGPRVQRWPGGQVIWFHRTTEDYVAELHQAGFRLVHLGECEPQYDRFDGHGDEYQRRRRIPLFLLLGAEKR